MGPGGERGVAWVRSRGTLWAGATPRVNAARRSGQIFVAPLVAEEKAAPEPEPPKYVEYPVLRCPACGSGDNRVTKTVRPVRHHKCRACGAAFQSKEGSC